MRVWQTSRHTHIYILANALKNYVHGGHKKNKAHHKKLCEKTLILTVKHIYQHHNIITKTTI